MSVSLPEGMLQLPERIFKNCSRLPSVILPASLSSIGLEAFYGCKSLADITLPATLESFGKECFRKCESLETFAFPEGTRVVGDKMLYDCDALHYVTAPFVAPPTVKHVCDVKKAVLLVPQGSVGEYKKADGWKKFKTIGELP